MNLMRQGLLHYTQKQLRHSNIKLVASIFFCLYFIETANAQPEYEFRGVWVATVSNIDWPSEKYLSPDSQRAEFTRLLDMHQRNGMNAIIAQVRPATDAFYPSQYEPWSEWLTGTQGKPPIPYYDPLQFMITETHKRGMEFHAWMNPYRAEFSVGKSPLSQTHITKLHPDWFLPYGTVKLFDPGNKEVQQFVAEVIRDVVSRYDIDAIHLDDYFYPYRIAGKEFPDSASFTKYGNGLNKDDWRRSNVDSIIVKLSRTIKEENKFCKFGVSPFGVWRNIDKDPEGSNTRAGQTNYDDLYADILLWLKNKWIDYVAPQLYWEFSYRNAPFGTLSEWWANHAYGRHLYIGHGIYRALEGQSAAWRSPNELPNQIKKIREYPEINGSIYYSSKWFARNPNGWNDTLQNNYYKYPAIVPPMPWIDSIKPEPPVFSSAEVVQQDSSKIDLHFSVKNYSSRIKQYAVGVFNKQYELAGIPVYNLLPAGKDLYLTIFKKNVPADFYIAISAVSKTNNVSKAGQQYNVTWTGNGWTLK